MSNDVMLINRKGPILTLECLHKILDTSNPFNMLSSPRGLHLLLKYIRSRIIFAFRYLYWNAGIILHAI